MKSNGRTEIDLFINFIRLKRFLTLVALYFLVYLMSEWKTHINIDKILGRKSMYGQVEVTTAHFYLI